MRQPLREPLRSQPLSKVYVGRSSIHGSGLFAREAISDGEEIGRFEGRPTRRDGCYVLWVSGKSGYRGIEGTTDLRFVNHSASPNAEFVEDMLVALTPIAAGDEITCHYGPDWEAEGEAELASSAR